MQSQLLFAIIAGGLVFATLLLLFSGMQGLFGSFGRADKLKSRVEGYGQRGLSAMPETSLGESLAGFFSGLFARIGTKVAGNEKEKLHTQSARVRFLQAGIAARNAPMIFKGVQLVLALAFAGGAFLFDSLFPDVLGNMRMAGLGGAGLVGYMLPGMWLSSRTSKRKVAIVREMPDALDLLVVCVEAGMGLDQSLSRVAEELKFSGPTICSEFRTLNLELRAGLHRQEALKNLALRIGVSDIDSLVALLIQADLFGTSVAQTLRVYSDTLRTKRYQRAEEKAAKLPVTLLIPLILFIFPSLLIVIIGPAAIQLMQMFTHMK